VNLTGMGKDEPIYLLCRGGVRSLVALSWMRINGFTNVRNIVGGKNRIEREGIDMCPVEMGRQKINL